MLLLWPFARANVTPRRVLLWLLEMDQPLSLPQAMCGGPSVVRGCPDTCLNRFPMMLHLGPFTISYLLIHLCLSVLDTTICLVRVEAQPPSPSGLTTQVAALTPWTTGGVRKCGDAGVLRIGLAGGFHE